MPKELETLKIFFNIYTHLSDKEYNAKQGSFTRILPHHKIQFNKFCSENRYNVLPYTKYSKQNIVLLAISNNLLRKSFDIKNDLNLKVFARELKLYNDNMNKDIEYIYNNIEAIEDLYSMYVNNDIKWYSFYYTVKYIKFNKRKYIINDIFKKRLKHIQRVTSLLDFKDAITNTTYFEDLQKKVDMLLD